MAQLRPAFPAMVSALAARAKDLKAFAVVGHVPDLESLAHGLLGGQPAEVHLKTGGLVQVEIPCLAEPFEGKLLFSINPDNISV